MFDEHASLLQALRFEAGEELVLKDNFFIEKILPEVILRTLSAEEMAEYRRPLAEPARGDGADVAAGDPHRRRSADVTKMVSAYGERLAKSNVPKLFVKAEPGALLPAAQILKPPAHGRLRLR
jgi:haloalkane dehalogenase